MIKLPNTISSRFDISPGGRVSPTASSIGCATVFRNIGSSTMNPAPRNDPDAAGATDDHHEQYPERQVEGCAQAHRAEIGERVQRPATPAIEQLRSRTPAAGVQYPYADDFAATSMSRTAIRPATELLTMFLAARASTDDRQDDADTSRAANRTSSPG